MTMSEGVSPVTEPTIERLRELALKATAGPWGVFPWEDPDDGKYLRVARNSGGLLMPVARSFGDSLGDDQDTAYIAAVDPTTVLALLAELASLRSQLTAAVQERDDLGVRLDDAISRSVCEWMSEVWKKDINATIPEMVWQLRRLSDRIACQRSTLRNLQASYYAVRANVGLDVASLRARAEKAEAALAAREEVFRDIVEEAQRCLKIMGVPDPAASSDRYGYGKIIVIARAALSRLSGESTPHKGEGE